MIALPSIDFPNRNAFDGQIKFAAKKFGIPFYLLKALIAAESSFNPVAQASTTTARGLTQLTKAAAKDAGADWNKLFDPGYSIFYGAKYLRLTYDRLGTTNWLQAARAYFQGVGNEIKYGDEAIKTLNTNADFYVKKIRNYILALMLKDPLHIPFLFAEEEPIFL